MTTTLFADGFESGTLAAWSGSDSSGSASTVRVTNTAAFDGADGLDTAKLGSNDNGRADVRASVAAPGSHVMSLRAHLQIVSSAGSGGLYLQWLYRGGPVYQPIVALRALSTGYALELRNLDGTIQNTPLHTQLVSGTWYDVELIYDWSGNQPTAEAYVNGKLDSSLVDTTSGTLYAPDSAYVGAWEASWTRQLEAYWDDVSVADGLQSGTTKATPAATATPDSTATTSASGTYLGQAAPVTSGGDEWTQDGHDAQHTGATSEEPGDSWSFAWAWNGPDAQGGASNNLYRAPSGARTIMGGGHLYAPAGGYGPNLGLYALNLTDGSVAWHFTAAAIMATPAYDPATGAVFAGGADGKLYKLDGATGAILGTYDATQQPGSAGVGLNTAVVLVGGAVYVTDSHSNLHKVDTASMAGEWFYPSGCAAPADCTQVTQPAYSASRQVVVYAAGDLSVHAVNASDGSRTWRVTPSVHTPSSTCQNANQQPFNCYSFAPGWPVIAEQHGLVLLRMQLDENDALTGPGPNGEFPTTMAGIRSFLQQHPDQQNLFALSLDDGSQPFVPAVGYGSVDGLLPNNATCALNPNDSSCLYYRQMPSPPVVKVWPNGDEVVYIQFRDGVTSPTPPDGRWDAHMGEMVLDGTTEPGLQAGDLRFVQMSSYGNEGGNADTYITDEEFPLSMAGSTLLYSSYDVMNGAQITNRAPSLGSYSSPITSTALPPVVRRIQTGSGFPCPTLAMDPTTHYANCHDLLYSYHEGGRSWTGPGFWTYWNTDDFALASNGEYSIWTPRYAYVSDGLVVVEGNGGDLMVFSHSAQPSTGANPSPSPTPSLTPAAQASGLSIGAVTASANSVAQYDELTLSFGVSNTVASNLQLPYDPTGAPGLAAGQGISVDAELLPPGQSDWSQALIQPAFVYQAYQRQQVGQQQWLYPQGQATWQVRVAPTQQGTWQVRLRAQDGSVCPTVAQGGGSSCSTWVRSPAQSFSVTAPRAGQHGFLQVSPTDSRTFQYSDGTPFFGQGMDDSFGMNTYTADSRLATDGQNGVSLLRVWLSGQDIAGSAWSPWWAFAQPGYGAYLPESGLQPAPAGSGHDFAFTLTPQSPCILQGYTQQPISVQPSTRYQLRVTYQQRGVVAANGGQPAGLTALYGQWPTTSSCQTGLGSATRLLSDQPNSSGDSSSWQTVSSTFTTGANQQFLPFLYLLLDNASAGQVQISQVSLQAVQADGSLGPEILAKPNSDAHEDFDPQASWVWDHIIATAAQDGVALKLVTLEKNDRVWNRLQADGSLGTQDVQNDNFYSQPGTKVRVLQQAYWRYLVARWGYATSVHSWELLNEGDPADGNHVNQAEAFAQAMHQGVDRHLATTSTWGGFPVAGLWASPQAPDLDYADVHAYVSTGLTSGGYAWDPPSPATLDTNPADTQGGSGGALELQAGQVTSSNLSVPIRGQGTWTLQVQVKGANISGTCNYGISPSLAGPQVLLGLDGATVRAAPTNPSQPPANYFVCSGPAGTYGYQPISATLQVGDSSWHSLTVQFSLQHATSGTAWFDNLQIVSPDGRQLRVLGDGSFDDHQRLDLDLGGFNQAIGLKDGAQSLTGAGKPVIRGETGIDYPGGPQTERPELAQDTAGVWLHNLLWGALNPGDMIDLYWWSDTIRTHNLVGVYQPVAAFMAGVPFNNGRFGDAQAQTSHPGQLGVMGQTDASDGLGYVWVRNLQHTWWNVVTNTFTPSPLSGTVSLGGFTPNQAYAAEAWAFDGSGALSRSSFSVTADQSGTVTFDTAALPASTTDVAYKLTGPAS